MSAPSILGPIALVGSGEYTAAMNETDAWLLERVGGAARACVALLPTAAGREPGEPTRWNAMGQAHFAALGVRDVRSCAIVDAASARDEAQLALLRDATYFYFSGGDPQQVIESLRGSPAWSLIQAAHERGAVMAGCSAGAMAFSSHTISIRQLESAGEVSWIPSLALVPRIVVFPHFDRMAEFVSPTTLQRMLASTPSGSVAVGVDEDTALVRLAPDAQGPLTGACWRVTGRQTVSIYAPGGVERQTLTPGEEIAL